jgi:drug/metabolite transporter (DMT)-like permease
MAGSVLAWALYTVFANWSLTHLDASQAANYVNLLPIVGVAIAVLFLGEGVVPIQVLGGALVVLGVWCTTRVGDVSKLEVM